MDTGRTVDPKSSRPAGFDSPTPHHTIMFGVKAGRIAFGPHWNGWGFCSACGGEPSLVLVDGISMCVPCYRDVAQWREHTSDKREVGGSSPPIPTSEG